MEESVNIENIKKPIPVLEINTAQGVKEYFDFADPELGVDWGTEGVPKEYTPEYIISHPNETRIFVIRNESNEIIAGGKVTSLNEEMKMRLGLNEAPFVNKQGALLEYIVVRSDRRREKILQVLTKKRIDWAKEHKAEYVCTEIAITNAISAHTKTRDGFVFIGIKDPCLGITEPYLVAVKSILDTSGDNLDNEDRFEKKEIQITKDSQKELEVLFSEGWVGIDAKIPTDLNTESWKLVLERNKI